jgi:hypothetical protein
VRNNIINQIKHKLLIKIDYDLIWSYLNSIIGLFLSLLVSLLILKYLTIFEYSIYLIFNSFFGFVNVGISAISPNISRNIAVINFNKEYSQFREFIMNLNSIIVGIIITTCVILCGYFFYNYNANNISGNLEKNIFFFVNLISFIVYIRYSFSSSTLRGLNLIKLEQKGLTFAQFVKSFLSIIIIFFFKSVYFFPISIFGYIVTLNYFSVKYLNQNKLYFNIDIFSFKTKLINNYTLDIIKSSFNMLIGNSGNYLSTGVIFLILITQNINNSGLIANYQYVIVISALASTLYYRHQINFVQCQNYLELISLFKKLFMYVSLLFLILVIIYFFLINKIFFLIGKDIFILNNLNLIQIFINVYFDTILIGFSLLLSSKKIFSIQYTYLIISLFFILVAYFFNYFSDSFKLLNLRIFSLSIITLVAIYSLKKIKKSLGQNV